MGLLGKLFGGGKKASVATSEIISSVECPHAVLVPRWENVQDMGIADKATRYMCEACKQMFTPQETEALRESLAERVTATQAEIDAATEN